VGDDADWVGCRRYAGGDGLFTMVVMSVAGTIITKLARNCGIEKSGWLGVGGKSIVVLLGLS
jgi:hypothetical protein